LIFASNTVEKLLLVWYAKCKFA